MTCCGPIGTKLCCEWSANASESRAIVRAPSVRVGSVSVIINVVTYVSTVVTNFGDIIILVLGIFANHGGALRSWEGEFVTLTFEP